MNGVLKTSATSTKRPREPTDDIKKSQHFMITRDNRILLQLGEMDRHPPGGLTFRNKCTTTSFEHLNWSLKYQDPIHCVRQSPSG